MKIIVAAAVFLCFSATLHAQKSGYYIIGAGTLTCAEVGSFYKKAPEDASRLMMIWAYGFASGINSGAIYNDRQAADLPHTDAEQQAFEYAILDYCNQHPLARLFEAVASQYAQIRDDQKLSSWR